ncbi:acyl transferase domain-containing protein [Chryseobacterium sp. 52]|uniref:type I polyketide synthase n=1 Tax=Chryseobacterium sp. 52 TaxID=2035213 RepID=UPI000C17E951|nr:type I polyketide synthase [Chryseobacterium sp. 52]PIF44697.1 acyl transferase domain-containing protein [Chryseobacterium sp. 52]
MDSDKYINDIAIVGMSLRFPGSKTIDEFWKNLCDAKESISVFSDEELRSNGIPEAFLNAPNYVKANGALEDIDMFDGSFFGYTPAESKILPPQFRLFLECTWEALEDSGNVPNKFPGTIGLYAGSGMNSYLIHNILTNKEETDAALGLQLRIFNDKDFLPLHASYKLNLKGPSLNIQTACSTSLVAVHMACQSLLNGECDLAMAGGASVDAIQKTGYFYEEGFITSRDGHCRTFDEAASGSVSGNGVGVIALKRMSEALEDKDHIYAVIKGSAINNDGNHKIGFTAPSVEGQAKVIAEAMSMAEVDASHLGYIEAHGTATLLGDPIEIAALNQAFAKSGTTGNCAIGSIKPNIGHADTAAGIAGLIKAALCLKYKMIPPTLHYKKANPKIDFKDNFYVNTELKKWDSEKKRYAGVSSFGIGGTNAHVVLSEVPEFISEELQVPELFLMSAKTETALAKMGENLLDKIVLNPEMKLADIAYTLREGREFFGKRKFFVSDTIEDLKNNLGQFHTIPGYELSDNHTIKNICFMFPGGGAHYQGMGKDLYKTEPVFKTVVDECALILLDVLEFDIRNELSYFDDSGNKSHFSDTAYSLSALFVVELAMAKLLESKNVKPTYMIGHSMGEYVAACLSGVFSLSDALKIVALRGKLFNTLPKGAMLSVFLSEKEIEKYLTANLSVAAVNSNSMTVISGKKEEIIQLKNELSDYGIECKTLHIDVAAHSKYVDAILDSFKEYLSKLTLNAPGIPFISNLSGTWITSQEATDPEYWVKHLRQTVQFSKGIENILANKNTAIIEVGPGRSLTTLCLAQVSRSEKQLIIDSMPGYKDTMSDSKKMLGVIGKLWANGFEIDGSIFNKSHKIPLPTYPFERKRYWITPSVLNEFNESGTNKLPLSKIFYLPSWKRIEPENTTNTETAFDNCVLIFKNETDFENELLSQIKKTNSKIIEVAKGETFQHNGNRFTIDIQSQDHHIRLFEILNREDKLPTQIIYSLPLQKKSFTTKDHEIDLNTIDRESFENYFGLLYLSQAIHKSTAEDRIKNIQIICITNELHSITGDEEIDLINIPLLGVVKVIPQEFTKIDCINIDLSISNKEKWTFFINTILNSINNETESHKIRALRGRFQWVPSYENIEISKSILDDHTVNPVRDLGVYIIAGGLGDIGLAVSAQLAKSAKAIKLILLNRSLFPSRATWEGIIREGKDTESIQKIQKIKAIEILGAEVILLQANVLDVERIENIREKILEKYGQINGIIQAVGQYESKNNSEIFGSKVKGTLILDHVFKNIELEMFILFSSLNSVIPVYGQSEYAASSCFLDGYANYRKTVLGKPTLVINWDRWQGMGSAAKVEKTFKKLTGTELDVSLSEQEGVEAFDKMIRTQNTQVLVSCYDLQNKIEINRMGLSRLLQDIKIKDSIATTEKQLVYKENLDDSLEAKIERIWKNIIGIDAIGIYENFFEIGGHSLMAARIISHIKKEMNAEISLVEFFKEPTIANLVSIITEQRNENKKPILKIETVSREKKYFTFDENGEIE